MRQVISILLENEAGALSRVVGLFSQRGYNIENITAAPTEDKSISRITILTEGDGTVVERITKQLHKLVNVIKVSSQQDNSCDIFKAEIVDITPELYILQFVNTSFEVDRFLKAVSEQAEVIETVRSGVCGIFRGEHSLHS